MGENQTVYPIDEASKFSVVGIQEVSVQDFQDEAHWREVLRYFFRHKGAAIASFVLLAVILLALLGPLLTEFTYDDLNPKRQNLPPRIPVLEQIGIFDGTRDGQNVYEAKGFSEEYHYFGTDSLGRDLWARTCYGIRISLYVALVAVLIDAVIGITLGLLCGYFGGVLDMIIQRIIEIIAGIPQLVVVTLLLIVLKPGLYTITIALMMTSWIGMSRVVRAQVLQHKEREYVLASKTMGTSTLKLLFREILPNTISQIIIMAMMSIPSAIFMESFLSFIGLGVPEPLASLGSLISNNFNNMLLYPYQAAIPVLFFSALMISFNLIADGLRDALDPTSSE